VRVAQTNTTGGLAHHLWGASPAPNTTVARPKGHGQVTNLTRLELPIPVEHAL